MRKGNEILLDPPCVDETYSSQMKNGWKIRIIVIFIFYVFSRCFIQRRIFGIIQPKIISVVQLVLMKFRLLNKLKVRRMSGETVSLKGMPCDGH